MSDGSLGYASRLSFRADLGGQLGAPELSETDERLQHKIERLAELLRSASHVVVFTGAGISTSTGIPDFRGPNGVWTRQRRGQPPPKASVAFSLATPSLTHQALLGLYRAGRLHYLVSQNVDCLHLRSGWPRSKLAELHGNCFAERCERCRSEYVRDFEIPSVGFKPTARSCERCGGDLRDNCLDWDDALPQDELALTEKHAARADLALCLGTSLQIEPACDLPLRALRKQKHKPDGGALAIVNLQATPKDRRASVVIHSDVDRVMSGVMHRLDLPIPPYSRTDALRVSHELMLELHSATRLAFQLTSKHGPNCPIEWLEACELRFEHAPEHPPLELHAPLWRAELPLDPEWCDRDVPIAALLRMHFARGATEPPAEVRYCFRLDGDGRAAGSRRSAQRGGGRLFEFVTCRVEYEAAAYCENAVERTGEKRQRTSVSPKGERVGSE